MITSLSKKYNTAIVLILKDCFSVSATVMLKEYQTLTENQQQV